MRRRSLSYVIVALLLLTVFSLASNSPVASQSYTTQTTTMTGTITNTYYSATAVTTYVNSSTTSTQLYSGVFYISPNQAFGGGFGNCVTEALPLDLQSGEKITGSVNADGDVYFGIETTDQYHLQFLGGYPSTCQAYVSYGSDQSYGKSFQFSWTAPSSGTFYFLFVNTSGSTSATKVSLSFRG